MEHIEWKAAYEVGIPEIDRQHRGMVRLINRLAEEHRRGGPIAWVFDELDLYVREHFALEERLMDRAGYPELAAHRAEHRAFAEWFGAVKRSHAAGAPVAALFDIVGDYLRDWLVHHILESDMAYRPWLAPSEPKDGGRG